MTIKKITVFGGTGMLGRPVVSKLAEARFEITALVRSVEKGRRVLPAGIRLVEGDLRDRAAIEAALEGAEGIYINLAVEPGSRPDEFQAEREGIDSILSAAKAAGVKRAAFCSSLVHRYQGMNGYRWWAFDIKREAVKKIKASGIPYTIFYPTSFMENFDKGGYKQGSKMMLAGKSKFPMYFIAGSDYGRQVARSFELLNDENREYAVQGLEAFTVDEAVKIFVENYQKEKLTISRAPLLLLKALGLFRPKMSYAAKIIEALNRYPEKFESEATWQELGRPEVTLVEYARASGR